MSLKLNKISDETIQENLLRDLPWIARQLETPPRGDKTPAELEKYYYYLGSTSSDVGLMLYQQERAPEEIRVHLARAGDALLRAHEVKPKPRTDEYRSPWDFEKTVNLVVGFSGAEKRIEASKIQEWQYRNPPHPQDEAFIAYLDILKKFIAADLAAHNESLWIEEHCLSDTASKEERRFLLPKIEGLRAVARQDHHRWDRAVADLVKAHETEAKRGEYRRLRDGLMSLPALMLARLGKERGLVCSVASPYLPLQLLG